MDALNQTQRIFIRHSITNEVRFPQLVVIGSQSCGKSTLLDMLLGVSLLPKGDNIATRTPILIQSANNPNLISPVLKLTVKGKETSYMTIAQLGEAISIESNNLAGPGKGISAEPLIINLEGSYFPNLSCVDLPGLTRIPVAGQPDDIENQTKNLAINFLRNEACVILAVSSANVDIANSESIRLAKMVDKGLSRTLCVITKSDLFEGDPKMFGELIRGKIVHARHGFVAMTNSSMNTFSTPLPLLNDLPNGKEVLTNRISSIMANLLATELPKLKEQITKLLSVA